MRVEGWVFGERFLVALAAGCLGVLTVAPAGAAGGTGVAPAAVEEPAAQESQLAAIARRMEDTEHAVHTRAFRARAQVAAGRQPDARLAEDALHLRRLVRFLAARLDAEEEGAEVTRLRKLARALDSELGNLDRYARGERPSAAPPLAGPGGGGNSIRGGSGGFSGRVTSLPGGVPLFDVEIDVYDSYGFFWYYTYTDAAGNYAIDGLPPGTYHARTFNWQAYLNELYDNLPCPGYCDPTAGTPIPVTDGAVTAGIDFALSAGGVVTGRVREAGTGLALPGDLYFYDASGTYVGYAGTDTAGRYRIRGLATGTYYASASSSAHVEQLYDGIDCLEVYCDPLTGDPVAATAGQTTDGIDFSLRRQGAISGTVTDAATGEPVAFVEVSALQVGGYWSYAYANANGHYTIGGLDPGSYRLRTFEYDRYRDEVYDDLPCSPIGCPFDSGTLVAVELEATTSGIDFELDRLGSLSGTITEAGSGGTVDGAFGMAWDTAGYSVGYSYADSTGFYRVEGLYPGTYFVTGAGSVHQRELYDDTPCPSGSCNPTTGTPVAVALSADTPGIDFSLEKLGSITGRVTSQATGEPVSSCEVELMNGAGGFVDWSWVDGQGFYLFEGLPAGNYFVVTRGCDGFLDELYDDLPCPDYGSCNPTTGDAIAVAVATETGGIDFALIELGRIRGRVVDAMTGAGVSSYVSAWASTGYQVAWDYADSLGYYELHGLEPGTYFVHAEGGWDHLGELYDGFYCPTAWDCDLSLGTPVPAAIEGVTTGIDFALERGPGLRGTVTAQGDGAPLPGVGIDVWLPNGQLLASTSTDAAGRYFFDLYEGSYRVSTDAGLGGIDEVFEDVACPQGSAYAGLCDPSQGSLVEVTAGLPVTADFTLSVASLFADGFETGDLSAWSSVVP